MEGLRKLGCVEGKANSGGSHAAARNRNGVAVRAPFVDFCATRIGRRANGITPREYHGGAAGTRNFSKRLRAQKPLSNFSNRPQENGPLYRISIKQN